MCLSRNLDRLKLIDVNFSGVDNVKAFYSTRIGGFSEAPYDSLNLAMHVNDNEKLVKKNRELLCDFLGKEITTSWMNQTHSTDVAIIDSLESAKAITDADAQITSMPNIALAVMTADCLPILLTVDDGSIVACIHGGWRGLSGGIVHNTISAMMVEPNRIHAWLGPCIGPKKFEVGDMVRSEFVEQNEEFSLFFHPIKNKTKYMADLQSIAIFQLKQQGVKNIIRDTSCTYCDSKRFFSYRRDGTTGRTAGFIWR